MNIDWIQVFPATAIGAGIGFGIGWLLRYVFVRWIEKRHLDEELNRGANALSLAEKLLALHDKCCDRNVNINFPLGKHAIEFLPITDDELAEDKQKRLEFLEVSQNWLVSQMWYCVILVLIKGKHIPVDEAIEGAEKRYVLVYNELKANELMRDYGDISLTQLVHAYDSFITQKTDASIDAVAKAMENWIDANYDKEEEQRSESK